MCTEDYTRQLYLNAYTCDIGSEAKSSWSSTFCFGLWEKYMLSRSGFTLWDHCVYIAYYTRQPYVWHREWSKIFVKQYILLWVVRRIHSSSQSVALSRYYARYINILSVFLWRLWNKVAADRGVTYFADQTCELIIICAVAVVFSNALPLPFFSDVSGTKLRRRLCVKFTDRICGLTSAQWLSFTIRTYCYRLFFSDASGTSRDCVWSTLTTLVGYHQHSDHCPRSDRFLLMLLQRSHGVNCV